MIYFYNKNKNAQVLDALQLASLLYLGLPLVVFFSSWLKWYYSLIMITFLITPLLGFNYKVSFRSLKKFSIYFLGFCCFLVLLGYGEIFPQSGDWGKHNAIFSQLYNDWNQPIFIQYEGVRHILCYGLGFYMVPAWIGGIFKSYLMIKWLVLINSTIGLTLIGLWCNRIWSLPLWACIFVFLVGNLDWVRHINWCLNNFDNGLDIFFHLGNIQFLTVIDQIPQHQIAILLIFLAFINQIILKDFKLQYIAYLIVVGFFWSPFIGFAILPVVFLINIKQITFPNFKIIFPFVFLIGIFLLSYYSSHLKVDNFTFEWFSFKKLVYEVIVIYPLLFGIPIALIFIIDRKRKFIKQLEINLLLSFMIITILYKNINYGFYNDFEGKTTFLIFFIFNIFILKVLIMYYSTYKLSYKITTIFFIFILAFMPIKIVNLKLLAINSTYLQDKFYCNPYLLSNNDSIKLRFVLQKVTTEKHYPFIIQYLGTTSKYSKQLLKDLNK